MKKLILFIILACMLCPLVFSAVPTQNNPFLLSVSWTVQTTPDNYSFYDIGGVGYVESNYTINNGSLYYGSMWATKYGTYTDEATRWFLDPLCYNYSNSGIIRVRMVSFYNSSLASNSSYSVGQCFNGTHWNNVTTLVHTTGRCNVTTNSNYTNITDGDWSTYSLYNTTHWVSIINGTGCYGGRWYNSFMHYIGFGNNRTTDYLMCAEVNDTDADGDEIKFLFDWGRNGKNLSVLVMPYEGNTSHLYDFSKGNATVTAPIHDPWQEDGPIWWDGMYFQGKRYGGDLVLITNISWDGEDWNESIDQNFTYSFYINYTDANCTPCQNEVEECTVLTDECSCISSWNSTTNRSCNWTGEVCTESAFGNNWVCNATEVRTNESLFIRGHYDYGIYLDAVNQTFFFNNGNSLWTLRAPADTILPYENYHLVLTRSGRNTYLYKGQEQVASGTDSGDIIITDLDFMKFSYPGNEYYGWLDDFYVYNIFSPNTSVVYAHQLGSVGWQLMYPDMTAAGDNWTCSITLIDANNSDMNPEDYRNTRKLSNVVYIFKTISTTVYTQQYSTIRDALLYVVAAFAIVVIFLAAMFVLILVVQGGGINNLADIIPAIVAIAAGFAILISILYAILQNVIV